MRLIGTCKTNDVSVMVFETKPDERKAMTCGNCPNWKPGDDCRWMGLCARDGKKRGHKTTCRHGFTTSKNFWSEKYWDMRNTKRAQVKLEEGNVSLRVNDKEGHPMIDLDALFEIFK